MQYDAYLAGDPQAFEDFLGDTILDWKVIIILIAGFAVGVLYGLWVKKRNPKS